jgi:hypothetical protein
MKFLKEALSKKLYHFTYINRLCNILKTNKFNLTPTIGSKSDTKVNIGKDYYMSLTTSKSVKSGYGINFNNPIAIRLEIDGDKLNRNNKGISVNYWGNTYPRDPNDEKYKNQKKINKSFKEFMAITDEMEERLVSDKPYVENANKYISSISILIDDLKYFELKVIKTDKYKDIDYIINRCAELNIPIYFYDELKYFSNDIKDKSVEFPNVEIDEVVDEDEISFNDNNILFALTYKDDNLLKEILDLIKKGEMYPGQSVEQFKERIEILQRNKYYNYRNDVDNFIKILLSDIKNMRNSYNKTERYLIILLNNKLRFENKDIYKYIKDKMKIGYE